MKSTIPLERRMSINMNNSSNSKAYNNNMRDTSSSNTSMSDTNMSDTISSNTNSSHTNSSHTTSSNTTSSHTHSRHTHSRRTHSSHTHSSHTTNSDTNSSNNNKSSSNSADLFSFQKNIWSPSVSSKDNCQSHLNRNITYGVNKINEKKNIYPQESVCTSANNITCFNTENMLADKYLKNDILNNRYNDNILKNMKEHQTELSYDENKRNQKNIHTMFYKIII